MKNGIKDGTWKGDMGGVRYTETYKKGKLIRGESDKDGKYYHYEASLEKSAEFPGGMQAFYQFIGSTTHYPDSARANNIQGKVYASFVINKDGSLNEIKILKAPSNDIADETVRVLKLSPPWTPGNQRGIAVRQQFTVPINYSLAAQK
jgi:TonB family protein